MENTTELSDVAGGRWRAATLALALVMATVVPSAPLPAAADTATTGEFRVSNYADGFRENNYLWRGYAFTVARNTTVTHLIGGGGSNCAAGFEGGLYQASLNTSDQPVLDELLAGVEFNPARDVGDPPQEETVQLDDPVELAADQLYFIAQGRVSGGSGCHYAADTIDVEDLKFGSPIIDQWLPDADLAFQPSGSGTAEDAVGRTASSTTDVRVLMGFQYDTDVTAAVIDDPAEADFGPPSPVSASSVTLRGHLADSGATEDGNEQTALYFEWGTSPSLAGSTLAQVEQLEGATPDGHEFDTELSGLTPGETYYYRSVAVNEFGRTDGEIRQFTFYPDTLTVTQQPTSHTAGTSSDPAPSVEVTGPDNTPVAGQTVTVTVEGAELASGETEAVTDSGGAAVFDDLVIEQAATDIQLTFDGDGSEPVTTALFTVTADDPAPAAGGTTITADPDVTDTNDSVTVTVTIKDQFGNPTADPATSLTLQTDLGTFPGGNDSITQEDDALVEEPDGVFTTTLTASRAGVATITGLLDGTAIADTATVEVNARPAAAPETPTGVAGNGQVSLSWQTPEDDGGADITGYRIEYREADADSWEVAATDTATTATSKVVHELTNGVSYVFRVAAITTIGTGAVSPPSAPLTPQTPPPPPPPTQDPEPDPTPVEPREPGAGGGTIDGQETTLEVRAVVVDDQDTTPVEDGEQPSAVELAGEVDGNPFSIVLEPADEAGERGSGTVTGTQLRLTQGEGVQTRLSGFAPNSEARLSIFSEPRELGTFSTDGAGNLAAAVELLPEGITACQHTLQVTGTLTGGQQATAELGVWVLANPFPYPDVTTVSTHAPAIGCLNDLGGIIGFNDGDYDQQQPTTRGQAATILTRLLGLDPADPSFGDAGATHAGSIGALEAAGILNGHADGTVRPHSPLTRGQAASLLAAAAGLDDDPDAAAPFPDAGTTHAGSLGALIAVGGLTGFTDGTLRPDEPVTRGQFATMVVRLRDLLQPDTGS